MFLNLCRIISYTPRHKFKSSIPLPPLVVGGHKRSNMNVNCTNTKSNTIYKIILHSQPPARATIPPPTRRIILKVQIVV